MHTILGTLGFSVLLTAAALAQSAPLPPAPIKEGRLTKVDDAVYVDLGKVKVIKAKIWGLFQRQGEGFPLTAEGILRAVELVKKQMSLTPAEKEKVMRDTSGVPSEILKNMPQSAVLEGKDRLEVSASISMDETVVQFKVPGHPITDAAEAERILNLALFYLTRIHSLAQ